MTTPIEFGTTSQKNSSSQTKKQQQSHVTTTTNKSISGSSSTSLSDWSGGAGVLPGRAAVGPLFLMAITPVFVMVVCHVFTQHRGNAMAFSSHVHSQYAAQWAEINNNYASTTTTENSKLSLHYEAMVRLTKAIVWEQIWPSAGDWFTWHMIASFLIFQLALMRLVPGKAFVATVTPTGHRPVYKANGMASFLITLCVLMALDYTDTFRMSLVYDNFGTILSSMNVLAWIVCALLVVKGTIAPSGRDSGCTGSYITNFYWGMELYPRVLGWDVKQFTNCRAGMMFWAVAIVSFCYKNMELNGGHLQYGLAVSVALQLIYIAKFFHWEMGYMCRYVRIWQRTDDPNFSSI